MKRLPALVLVAVLSVLMSCTGAFEKYVTTNRGILFSYGQGFAFTSLRPSDWMLDKATAASNEFNFLITPTNSQRVAIYSYGIVIPKNTSGMEQISNDILYLFNEAKKIFPDITLENLTNKPPVDKARDVRMFIINNRTGGKDFYKVYTYVVWREAVVALVFHAEDEGGFVLHYITYNYVLDSIRYWGEDSKPLIDRLKRLTIEAAKKNLTNS